MTEAWCYVNQYKFRKSIQYTCEEYIHSEEHINSSHLSDAKLHCVPFL